MRSSAAVVGARAKGPVERYAESVVAGKIVACHLVRLACDRHLRDLKTAKMRGLRWDPDAAQHAIDFFRFLRHSKGRWAGSIVELEPWQQFRIGCVFGWMRWDEDLGRWVRRFRTAYNSVARKNGKSTEAAGVGLYLLDADAEPGSEVYAAATKRDQAKIVWGEAARMVRKSPDLLKRIRVLEGKGNMSVLDTESKFEPLGADKDTLDGLNVHGALIDELHAHKTRDVYDVLNTATGARSQALLWIITTAGVDQDGICYEVHQYTVAVLEGRIEDDRFFGYIATLDNGDDPFDERNWPKANPNIGVSVGLGDLRALANEARQMPSKLNSFLRLRMNVWTQQAEARISLPIWDENAGFVDSEGLKGRACYGGLDLSSVQGFSAWVLVFPDAKDPELVDVLCRFWVPEARLKDDSNRYRDQYQTWAREGLLVATPGEAIDHDFIVAQILKDAEIYQLVYLNIDRLFQAHQVSVKLSQEGLQVIGMGQGFVSMAAPYKEFERRLLRRKIRHGGNKVLRWMAGNLAVEEDAAGNLKPSKRHAQGKIDGIVGLVMAIDRAMRHEDAPRFESFVL